MASSSDNLEEDENDASAKGGKGPGLIVIAGLSLVVALAAGTGGYFLTNTSQQVAEAHPKDNDAKDSHGQEKDKGHAKKADKKAGGHKKEGPAEEGAESIGGKWSVVGDYAYFELDPLIISINPIGRSKHLKVSLVIETSIEAQSALTERIFFIQDALTVYLRSVEDRHLEDPAAMSDLRRQLERRIRFAAPGVEVSNLLITEFILT